MLKDLPPILVYYRFRGQLQPIRTLFCYLEIPFLEIHLDYLEEQKKSLSPVIINHVLKFRLQKNQLPALIHGELVVEGFTPITIYIIKKFERQELLGSSMKIRAKVQQILQIYLMKQSQVMASFFVLSDLAATKSLVQTNEHAKRLFDNTMRDSKFVKEICQYLDKNENIGYIFGELTIIDFFFLQTCVYMNGIYSHPDRNNRKELEGRNLEKSHFLDKPNSYYLTIMQDYELRLKGQEWYANYEEYLDSFSIISSILPATRAKGLRRIWVGNSKAVA